MMHTRKGKVIDIHDSVDMSYIFSNMAANDWSIVKE